LEKNSNQAGNHEPVADDSQRAGQGGSWAATSAARPSVLTTVAASGNGRVDPLFLLGGTVAGRVAYGAGEALARISDRWPWLSMLWGLRGNRPDHRARGEHHGNPRTGSTGPNCLRERRQTLLPIGRLANNSSIGLAARRARASRSAVRMVHLVELPARRRNRHRAVRHANEEGHQR